jgi:hypothetical protein
MKKKAPKEKPVLPAPAPRDDLGVPREYLIDGLYVYFDGHTVGVEQPTKAPTYTGSYKPGQVTTAAQRGHSVTFTPAAMLAFARWCSSIPAIRQPFKIDDRVKTLSDMLATTKDRLGVAQAELRGVDEVLGEKNRHLPRPDRIRKLQRRVPKRKTKKVLRKA